MADKMMEILFDVQSDLPRQGPGDSDSTRRALTLCRPLPDAPQILDIGCGPGAQTLVLAEELREASITAIDIHQPYLEELQARAMVAGVSHRVTAELIPMEAMTFAPETFDLIWAEGSAYLMGFTEAVATWRPLLKAGGFLAVTELVWLADDKPKAAADFFEKEYPAMLDVAGIAESILGAGYEIIDHFTLPDSAWWDAYYTPLLARLPALESKYARNTAGMAMIATVRREIETRRCFASSYGYEFFVAHKSD